MPRRLISRWFLIGILAFGSLLTAPAGQSAPDADPLAAVVRVNAEVPPDARTARGLGTNREGSGIVIDSRGLVLTIGYLILEATSVTLTVSGGEAVPGKIIAYDYDTGFGLVRATRPLDVRPVQFGDSARLTARDRVLVADYQGAKSAVGAYVVSRRKFAGFWEYMLDDAIFTSPPHPNWGGAALLGDDGKLNGIGSLLVNNAAANDKFLPGNMFVPIDLLKPVFVDLLTEGRARGPVKPWLGIFTAAQLGRVVVMRVSPGGPADKAGVRPGDTILDVAGNDVATVPEFYRALWAQGEAGVAVPLTILRGKRVSKLNVGSADRYDYLRIKRSY